MAHMFQTLQIKRALLYFFLANFVVIEDGCVEEIKDQLFS